MVALKLKVTDKDILHNKTERSSVTTTTPTINKFIYYLFSYF